jgi:Holliday junction resolvasome RuvABC endonuclease subunit
MPKKKLVKKEDVVCKDLKDPMFVGIDPSYNGFAIIVIDKDGEILEQKLISSDSDKEAEERIVELEKEFKFIPSIICLHSVCIEGPSYSSNGAFQLQMGALHYYLRLFLFKKKVKYKIIAPGTLKKFVCGEGKGHAKKELMLLNVYKNWGVEFNDNNLADAYGLARMALEDYNNERSS